MYYPVIPGESGTEAYGIICDMSRITDCSSKKRGWACCPVCGAVCKPRESGAARDHLLYTCGGAYRATVDRDGNPVWMGRCGAKMKQTELFGGTDGHEDQETQDQAQAASQT
jgi:hypothetical protein